MCFDLSSFINENVILRNTSLFNADIRNNDFRLRSFFEGKTMLVIGGAGSIGTSFVKATLHYNPISMVVVDTNENALTELTRDLRSSKGQYIPSEYITYPMDYSSAVFEKMYRKHGGFDIVANFSAHKHVRSEKDIFSVEALLRNNVINTIKLLELMEDIPPKAYFCVSTDKAANPVNIMGASKRIMEDVIFAYSDRFDVKTARFANVAFSNGSLLAGFIERINKCQPISAPSDIKRYFVSPQESGQICMLSCALAENREVLFPKLNESQMMSFDEIAKRLLEARGYDIYKCSSESEALERSLNIKSGGNIYPVYFSQSNTSGEKKYEEFFTGEENVDLKRFKSLGVIIGKKKPDKKRIKEFASSLDNLFEDNNATKDDVVNIMKKYLPDFNHIETGRSLDEKM